MTDKTNDQESAPDEVSPELDQLSCELLGQALDVLEAGEQMPVMLAVEDAAGTVSSCSFADDDPDVCIEAAHGRVRSLARDGGDGFLGVGAPVRYALVYDGDVEDESGAYHPAAILEFGEKGAHHAWSAFVCYSGHGKGFSWSDPAPAGEVELLL